MVRSARWSLILGASILVSGCAGPDYADPGENFARYEIASLVDSLDGEFKKADRSSTFRTRGELGEAWVSRIQNWEAARREIVRKANARGYESLSRAASDLLLRPMISALGDQRMRDLRAARIKMDYIQRIVDSLEE